jgi:hypothetical protein
LLGSEYLPRALVRQLDGGEGRKRKVLLAAEKKMREEKRKEVLKWQLPTNKMCISSAYLHHL